MFRKIVIVCLGLFFCCCTIRNGKAQTVEQDIQNVSLDSLLNIQISTAAKYEQTSREAASSVTIITADDIQCYDYQTLDEALRSVRGFYTRYDRNYMYLGVRGFSRPADYGSRVLLLINGHTVNENFYSSAFIGTDFCFDMNMIERIEIVRGPGSALYGNAAMFSVINIITTKAAGIEFSSQLLKLAKVIQ